jgi:ADP-heptose:LPS heptosyltransferase
LLPTPSQPQASPQTQERFLIVNLTPHLGDTIMQMPMIEALRKMHPKARIEFAAEAGAAPLLRMMPILDHVYALKLGHVPPTTPWMATKRTLNVVRRYWQEMRQSAPSVCLMPRWGYDLFRSNMLAYLIRAPRRIGFASDVEVTQQPAHYRNKLLTEPVHGGTGMHEPEKFCLLLVAAGLVPQSAIREAGTHAIPSLKHIADATNWPALAARIGVNTSAPFAVIAPGASMRRRVWPIESWAVVAESLRDQDMQVVLLAGPQDVELTRQLNELTGRRTTLVAGETSLPESVTLISHARLMLGNDSGPGHIAGALGVPSVILFIAEKGCDHDGPSSPERIRPVGPYVAVCRPTHCLPPCILSCEAPDAHCITTILPSEVVRAAQEILQAKDTAEKIETSS